MIRANLIKKEESFAELQDRTTALQYVKGLHSARFVEFTLTLDKDFERYLCFVHGDSRKDLISKYKKIIKDYNFHYHFYETSYIFQFLMQDHDEALKFAQEFMQLVQEIHEIYKTLDKL